MKTYFIDSFANEKFKGNPAAVCFPEGTLDEATMQSVANEIGFSETAFVERVSVARYTIRFFTPKQEIPICGHATLAAAKVVFAADGSDSIVFINLNGLELRVSQQATKMTMQFPMYDLQEFEVPIQMSKALGIQQIVCAHYNKEVKVILIEIENWRVLDQLKPDFAALLNSYQNINGVCVTAASPGTDYDFHYRFFWPWSGTQEDPVTGGVQTFLTPYWATKLKLKKMRALQSSERTGVMELEFDGERVLINGEAVSILEGNFMI